VFVTAGTPEFVDLAREVGDALRALGLDVREVDGALTVDGTPVALNIVDRAHPTPADLGQLVDELRGRHPAVVVADRISDPGREVLRRTGWGWLDRRGHVRVWTPGLRVEAPFAGRAGERPRSTNPWTTVGLEVAVAALITPDDPVTAVTVTGGSDSASADLLAAWLGSALACPVTRERSEPGTGVLGVVLERASGPVSLLRPNGEDVALLVQPGQPPRRIALAPRQDRDCLAEELRRMDPDEVYGEVLRDGLARVLP